MEKHTKDCKTIILEMIELIPEDRQNLIKDLRVDYDFYLNGSLAENLQWKRTIGTLYKYIDKPSEDWEYRVVSVFTHKTVDEIKTNQEIMHKNGSINKLQ